MFVEREGWLPSARSAALVAKHAMETIPLLREADDFGNYYDYHRHRIGFDLDYVTRFLPPRARILEIGGLPYFLTRPMLSDGHDVTNLEKNSDEFDPDIPARFGMNVVLCDIDWESIPEDNDNFDAVILNEVFEHLRVDLIHSVREMLRVLRPGGRLLLSTPNLRSVRGLFNLLVRHEAFCSMGGIYHNFAGVGTRGVMGHVREYTSKEVADFLTALGFEVEGVIYRGSYSGHFWWRLGQYLTLLRPELKPSFSIVARKPLTG